MAESHREEIAKLEALYASNPGGRVFVHLAEAYRKAGELELARGILGEGLSRHPDSASGFVVLGRVLTDLGEGGEAEQAFRRVLELDAGNLIALRGLGDLAVESGRRSEALELYRELLSRNPSNEEVRSLIGRVERGEDVAEAAPEAQPPGGEAPLEAQPSDGGAAAEAAVAGPEAGAAGEEAGDAGRPEGEDAWRQERPDAWAGEPAQGEAAETEADAPVWPEPEPQTWAAAEPHTWPPADEDGAQSGSDVPEPAADAGWQDASQGWEQPSQDEEPSPAGVEEAPAFEALSGDDLREREPDDQPEWEPLHEALPAGGPDVEGEPADQPIAALSAAPGDTGPVEPAEAEYVADDGGLHGEPPDFGGLDLEPAGEFDAGLAEDDAGTVSLGGDERELDLQALLLAAVDAVPEPGDAVTAEPLELETLDAGMGGEDAEVLELPSLQLRDEQDESQEQGGSAAEFEGALDMGDLPDQEDFMSGLGEAAASSGAELELPGLDEGADEFDAETSPWEVEGFPELSLADEAEEQGEDAPLHAGSADHAEAVWPGETGAQEDADAAPLEPGDLIPGGYGDALGGEPEQAETTAAQQAAPRGDRGLETETMADLYRSQGFHQRAADVYRALLERRPYDERLAAKLREVEDLLSGASLIEEDESGEVWLREAGSGWTGEEPRAAEPYVWAEPALASEGEEDGPAIGAYLQGLASWSPSRAAAAGAVGEAAPEVPAEAELLAEPDAEAAPESGPESGPEVVLEPDPWSPDEQAAAAPASEADGVPQAEPAVASSPQAEPGPKAGRQDVEAAFDEWYGPGQAQATPQPAAEESEDDEDLAMFRSWLQSLKK